MYNRTPLSLAAEDGHDAVARLLLKKGAKIETTNEAGETPLSIAAAYRQEAITRLLLEGGAEVEGSDMGSETPLSLATSAGHEAVARLLIENGAKILSDSDRKARHEQAILKRCAVKLQPFFGEVMEFQLAADYQFHYN